MLGRAVIVFVLAGLFPLVGPSQELSTDVLTLARAMNTNRDLLKRLPLYTCLETIERSRPKEHGHASSRDWVQVDVGVGARKEMYSWPGETAFSSEDLPDLVLHGMISTGMFSSFARNIFIQDVAVIKVAGKDILQGRETYRFTYRVPSLVNDWKINWDHKVGQLQEAGEFWVDAQDYHLMRVEVDAHDIPPQMLLKSVTLTVDYEMLRQDAADTLLPVAGTMAAVDIDNHLFHNSLAFSHCHVFAAQSRVSESDADAASLFTRYKQEQGFLPPGLGLQVALAEAIPASTARVGDAIAARLQSPLRLNPETEIPAGALLKGRIRQFARLDDPPNTYEVGVAFSELDWGHHTYRFFAELVGMEPLAGIQRELVQNEGALSRGINGQAQVSRHEIMVAYGIPGAAVFFLRDVSGLPKGFKMNWRTTAVGLH